MKRLPALLFFATSALQAVDLTLTSPLDYQVAQRSSPGKGLLRIAGELSEDVPAEAAVQVRVVNDAMQTSWLQVNLVKGRKVIASSESTAGGWWKLEAGGGSAPISARNFVRRYLSDRTTVAFFAQERPSLDIDTRKALSDELYEAQRIKTKKEP